MERDRYLGEMQDEGDLMVDSPGFIQFAKFEVPEPINGEIIGNYHLRVVKAFEEYVNTHLVGFIRQLVEARCG